MPIYKMVNGKERLEKVDRTSFGDQGVFERGDLQRILRDQPDVLEEGLLIISEEFGDWQDSNRRIDLLALDATGRLTVVELKRGNTGEHMDLQAIRYAAMIANMTFQHTVETYQRYLDKRAKQEGKSAEEDDAAKTKIRDHLGITEQDNQAIHTEIPRLILAAEDFSKELTTCVMWLNDSWLRSAGQEIKCIRLQPHRNGDEVLIETSVVIPLPEASDYQTQLGKREQDTREQNPLKSDLIPGAAPFNESIAKAEEKFQEGLGRLYEYAVELERNNLTELFTYTSGKRNYLRLELRVPGKSTYLVSFNNLLFDRGIGEISLWPEWENYALNSLKHIDEVVGPVTSASGVRHRRLSTKSTYERLENILAAIGEAYREASVETSNDRDG